MAHAVENDERMASASMRRPSAMTLKVENLAQVRELVQKKTFTRWANMSLGPEDRIQDLFLDLQSGETLLKLVNALSENTLTPERGKMEIHHRANISRALDALASVHPRHGISISAIYEGIPKLTLALVWHLVLSYSHLQHSIEMGVTAETHCKDWCNSMTSDYVGLENIRRDFLGCWASGLVVPALINRNNPGLIDYSDLYHNKTPDERFQIAFDIAQDCYDVPKLLDVEDMVRSRVDEQSVITYVLHLNKTLSDTVPDLPPDIQLLKQQTRHSGQGMVLEEKEEEEKEEEEAETYSPELEVELEVEDMDLTPVDIEELDPFPMEEPPQILAQRQGMVYSTTPEVPTKSPAEEDKDSGLELNDSPVNRHNDNVNSHDKLLAREQNGLDTVSQRGSTVTLDSEADYISATSSPVVSRKEYSEDSASDHTLDNNSDESLTPPGTTALPSPGAAADPRYYHTKYEEVTSLPEDTPTTLPGLGELVQVLQEKGGQCRDLQREIHAQLNTKQSRDKRAELHQLLTQTGRFDDALNSATAEVNGFIEALEEFDAAVASCEEFAENLEEVLSERLIPSTSAETQQHLSSQQHMRSGLEEEQRKLEYTFRALTRAIPRVIPLSVGEQQRTATVIQNRLSDIELVLNGSIETLAFLCSRLPSMEQKLLDADKLITGVEDGIDRFERGGGNPDNLQFQLERAHTHLATVENLFQAIESFNNEFNLDILQEEWQELSDRCGQSERGIKDLLAVEEELSEEVIAVSDWAETLEMFLHRKHIKPISSRQQLREVQGKWRQVSEDLKCKCDEIEVLLTSDYSTHDLRVMSPLDKDTLLSLKHQLNDLHNPLQTRREMLQDAYSSWGNVEAQLKSISHNMLELEFRPARYPPDSSWAVRPALRYIQYLSEYESELSELSEQLQTVVGEISNLSAMLIDMNPIIREKEGLLNKHSILCKRASNKRIKSQRSVLSMHPVIPFLKDTYLKTLTWLYNQPLPDLDAKTDQSVNKMLVSLNNRQRQRDVPYSDYWHVLKTIAPEKIPYMALTWLVYALGPWGLGCATDRPMNIFEVTPEILI